MGPERKIMVVKRETLFSEKYFNGFMPPSGYDFESTILENFKWMNKKQAESDPLYKQPVGYSIIYNHLLKKVFLYRRSEVDRNYPEKRLQGRWSIGVGGHIEKVDVSNSNPIHASVLREIQEEIKITGGKNMRLLGYINDDSDNVGNVHFGILYIVEIKDYMVHFGPEISEGKLVPICVLEDKCNSTDVEVENWTRIALEPLKNI